MFPGWMQIGLVVLLIVLLFGRGKISDLMGDVAKGITSFRKGLKDDAETPAASEPKDVTPQLDKGKPEEAANAVKSDEKTKA